MEQARSEGQQFLELVLPPLQQDEGYRAELFDAPKGRMPLWPAYFDVNKLATGLLGAGQRGNAYFSPVTFKRGGARREKDALRCQVVWADLDVCIAGEKSHPPHHYASLDDARAALDRFALKPHIAVSTGHGALGIWRLKEPVQGEDLARLMRIVRGLAQMLPSDPNVAMATQLMRCPGTKNFDPRRRKDGVTHPVKLLRMDADLPLYTLNDFASVGVPEVEAKSKEHAAQMPLLLSGGKVVEKPPISPRMMDLLSTPGNGDYPSPSEADAAVITAMLGAGLSPADAAATFLASSRGKDAAERKSNVDDYVERTLHSAQGKVDADRRARDHVEAVASASTNGNGPSKAAPPTLLVFPEDAWHGIFSTYREAVATTEAPPQHHFATLCTVAGALLGRAVYVNYERPTYPNRNVALIGQTGAVRKTGTMRRGTDVLRRVDPMVAVQTGVGSAEGLAEAIAVAEMTAAERKRYEAHISGEIDKQTGEVPPVPLPPARGRRLLLVLEEFATMLGKARMEGTGALLPLVTHLYDCPDQLDHRLRSKSIVALSPTLSILTASAPTWIERYLLPSELLSGFANRFEYWIGEPGDPVPWPEPPRRGPLNAVLQRLRETSEYWKRPTREQVQFALSDQGRAAWEGYYAVFRSRLTSYDDQRAAVVQRAPTFAVKTALTFAALECGEAVISSEHIERAVLIADYLEACAIELLGGLGVGEDVKLQQKILERLARQPSKRRQVQQALSGRVGAPTFKRTWDALVDGKIIRCGKDEVWSAVAEDDVS